ncbi:MAG: RNA polymerase sigma factor [Myxococcaceae bacterium]
MDLLPSVRTTRPAQAATAEGLALERGWVRKAQGGDPEAFRAIFERYAPSVRRFLKDLLRDVAAADEATQETFVRAHSRLSSLSESHRLAGWLFGIARNVFFEHRRARWAGPFAGQDEGDEGPEVVRAVLPAPNPEAVLLRRELAGELEAALGRIRESRRAALLLRVDHGLGYEEIALALGWTLPKVKNEIHRARLELRVMLAGHLGGGG